MKCSYGSLRELKWHFLQKFVMQKLQMRSRDRERKDWRYQWQTRIAMILANLNLSICDKQSIFVGFYLMFVMNSTAFWLLLTVGILNMHNKDPQKRPPHWLQKVAVNVLAKLVCIKVVSHPNIKRRNGNAGDLMLRELNNKEIADTETEISWMKVAQIFDRFFLALFTVMSLVSMLIFLCFYPTNHGKDTPKDFPKEQVNWNFTDF